MPLPELRTPVDEVLSTGYLAEAEAALASDFGLRVVVAANSIRSADAAAGRTPA